MITSLHKKHRGTQSRVQRCNLEQIIQFLRLLYVIDHVFIVQHEFLEFKEFGYFVLFCNGAVLQMFQNETLVLEYPKITEQCIRCMPWNVVQINVVGVLVFILC